MARRPVEAWALHKGPLPGFEGAHAGRHPLHPVRRGLRPCRQQRGGVPAATAGLRGLAGEHGPVQQPHRLRRLARPGGGAGLGRGDHPGHRRAGCHSAHQGRALGLSRRPVAGRGRAAGGGARARRAARHALCLRPGDGRRGQGLLRQAGHSRVLPRPCGTRRRHRHPQPVRARLAGGVRGGRDRRRAGRRRGGARDRPAHRRLHQPRAARGGRAAASSPMRRARAGCAGRRACRSRSTAPAMPSPRCSWARG